MKLRNELIDRFPVSKLHNDLWRNLTEDFCSEAREFPITIDHFELDWDGEWKVEISPGDSIHLISIECTYDVIGDIHFRVVIGLGRFEMNYDQPFMFGIEKGLVCMEYNEDLSLYKYYFMMSKINMLAVDG